MKTKEEKILFINSLEKDTVGGCFIEGFYFTKNELEILKNNIIKGENELVIFEKIGDAVINLRGIKNV